MGSEPALLEQQATTARVPPAGATAERGFAIDRSTRVPLEQRFGHDFSAVRIHATPEAATTARELSAEAFTEGEDIAFATGRFAPATHRGQHLLAHELAHVVQQRAGRARAGMSQPGDAGEREAEVIAAHPERAASIRPVATASLSRRTVQRQVVAPTTPGTDPDAYIPIADYIRYVEAIEAALPSAPPQEILTRIRQEAYSGPGFDELIPDAPFRRLAPIYAQPPAGGTPLYYTNRLRTDLPSAGAVGDAVRHLTARANENAVRDNPSPYIVLGDGSRVDAGHLLLGLDSLLNPRVEAPYTAYGIPGIDPAGFAADLALASFWTTHHQTTGTPAANAAIKPATADFGAYYAASAPDEDLLGDIDAFSAERQWNAAPGQRLSQILRATYLGTAGGAAPTASRYRTFASRNGLGYSRTGSTITFDQAAIEATWGPRIDRLCDLFEAGTFSLIGSVTVGTARSRGTWPYSLPALRRFLAWLKPRLEAELASNP